MLFRVVAALLFGYLLGGMDFAVLVGRARGVDIYSVGSGNPGTSNVLRTMGKGAAAMVLVGDLMKGVIAAAIGFFMSAEPDGPFGAIELAALSGFAAVTGHCYPVLHRFRGGKGMATAAGVLLFVQPLVGLGLGVLWAVIVGFTRVASIGSLLVVALTIPALWWSGSSGWTLVWVACTLALIVYRHRGNIARLAGGGERKVVST